MKITLFFNLILVIVLSLPSLGSAQTNEFNYQGNLNQSGAPANGNYDFEFKLYDTVSGGTLLGTRARSGVPVSNGAFNVLLDFPATSFNGNDRYIEVGVKPAGSASGYTTLAPRQKITSSPYSIKSLNAANADAATNSTQLGGVNADQFVQTSDTRLSDNRNPLPGSASYIQNRSDSQGQTGNFSISGDGKIGGSLTAAIVNATVVNATAFTGNLPDGDTSYIQNRTTPQSGTTNFNISGNGAIGGSLTATTVNGNIFSGVIMDSSIYRIGGENVLRNSGTRNIFAGVSAGGNGADNSFFGYNAGGANLATGIDNSFFGSDAGGANTSGNENSFFGSDAGDSNTSGYDNSFFGRSAGGGNMIGYANSFFGKNAGLANTGGDYNAFFGYVAGQANTADNNSFFGAFAGQSNTTSTGNSYFGYRTGDQSTGEKNSMFGSNAGNGGNGSQNSFFGHESGVAGDRNTAVGSSAAIFGPTQGNNNALFGWNAGGLNMGGSHLTLIGANARLGSDNLSYAAAIGADSVVSSSNTIALGRSNGSDTVLVNGLLDLRLLAGGGNLALCRNFFGQVGACSSSLRYKTDIKPFNFGLNLVNRLRPITFNWKDGGMADLGLGAEDVAEVEPLLVNYNKDGQVEGVKYDRIGVVLLNAVKEQNAQIEAQQKQIDEQNLIIKQQTEQLNQQETRFQKQQAEIEVLKVLVCSQNPAALACQPKDKEKQQ